jgi:ABC-type multidrug transport system ATPase subunit
MGSAVQAAVAPESAPANGTAQSTPVAACLTLRGISKRWPAQPSPVLDGIDLAVAPGTLVAISGRNGAGKTTLLRIAAGLIAADAGSVDLLGLDVERDRPEFQRRLGFCAAGNTGLYARLKVEDHLDFWARLAYVPRRQRSRRIPEMLDGFGLRELCGRRVDRLSMGQRQRLRLALAFLHRPRLVLLDEPRTSLDDEGVEILAGALDELRGRGGTAIVCAPSGEDQDLDFDLGYTVAAGRVEPA